MKGQTKATKASDIKRAWHLVDLKEKTLGRIASEVAQLLMGKAKPYFVRNLDCGDFVIAINAKLIGVTGKKEQKKVYYRYSGYPGGLSSETLERMRKRKPEEIIIHAVKGMLPQNRLRDKMLTRLFVFPDEKHSYGVKFVNHKS